MCVLLTIFQTNGKQDLMYNFLRFPIIYLAKREVQGGSSQSFIKFSHLMIDVPTLKIKSRHIKRYHKQRQGYKN